MDDLILRELRESDERALRDAVAAWPAEEEMTFAPEYDASQPFAAYVAKLEGFARGENLPPRWVPSITMFGFAGDVIVGRLQLRLELNELRMIMGQIGYVVLPQFRKRGYASAMLRQGLDRARTAGMTRVLITCDDGNVASMRTIERGGGVLMDVLPLPDGQPAKRRYWIAL